LGARAGPGSQGPARSRAAEGTGPAPAPGVGHLPGHRARLGRAVGLRAWLGRAQGWAGHGCGELESSPAVVSLG